MISVIHVLSSLNLGGAERITVELAQIQRQKGLDVEILSLGSEQDFLVSLAEEHGIPLIFNSSYQSRLSRYYRLVKVFKRFDVVHIHSRGAFKFLAPLVPFLFRKKIVYTRHGLFPDDSWEFKLLYKMLRPFINYITFVADSGREVFLQNHHWSLNKLVVVSNGVSVNETKRDAVVSPITFGSVGRMVPIKGQRLLLESLAKVVEQRHKSEKDSFKLKFFGDGPLEAELREKAESIGNDIVEFCGQEPDLEKIYASIDVLIVASESEGLSMVIMEAMARGIPVIATDVGGNSTMVRNLQTGLLVPYSDTKSMATAMLKFISNPALISELGCAAQNMIISEFSLENTHNDYLKCYMN